MTLRLLDTFSGIGGFSLAARWLGGFQTVQFVERDPYCQRILKKHWPDVPIHDDICTFQPEPGSADVVCGGFPCQDISTAGKQAGIKEGTRSGLFYELMRVVRLVGPRYVVLENVAAIVSNGLDTVLGEMAAAGYDTEWACIPAADVGACHRRDRWWCVAYANDTRHKTPWGEQRATGTEQHRRLADAAAYPQGGRWGAGTGQGTGQARHQGPGAGDGDQGSDAAHSSGQGLQAAQPARICPDAAEAGAGLQPITGGGAADAAYAPHLLSHGSAAGHAREPGRRAVPESGDGDCAGDTPDPHHQRQQERQPAAIASGTGRPGWGDAPRRLNPDWRSYLSEPVLCRGDDGFSGRVDRLRALGNAVVPQVAMVPLARALQLEAPV